MIEVLLEQSQRLQRHQRRSHRDRGPPVIEVLLEQSPEVNWEIVSYKIVKIFTILCGIVKIFTILTLTLTLNYV